MPQDRDTSTKEIAVSLRQTDEKIEHADFLAQTDQQGSGQFREAHRMSSDMPSPLMEQHAGEELQESLDMLQQQQELSFEEKVLMTTLSWQKQAEENQRKKMQEQLQSQFQAKAAMVASLEAQYLQRQQNFSRQQKIKTVDGIQSKAGCFGRLSGKVPRESGILWVTVIIRKQPNNRIWQGKCG